VPQELSLDVSQTVLDTVKFSRGLFGKSPNPGYIQDVLRTLTLWEKRDSLLETLSGGMKRRVLIAKALAHEPQILFLDEPTAGVDVELRHSMWQMMQGLRERGVTIILTTHYLEEAEEMADRIGVIRSGQILLLEEKAALMRRLGKKRVRLQLHTPLADLPTALASSELELSQDGYQLVYTFDAQGHRTGIVGLLNRLNEHGIPLKDVETSTSTLEEIFVDLMRSSP
jgi:ABC-2 type transport system ATP-binding protein